MKNWKKLDKRTIRILAKRMGLPAKARTNFMWMIGEIKSKGYVGLFQITTECKCGRNEKMIVFIKKLSGRMKELHDADKRPKIVCSKCQREFADAVADDLEIMKACVKELDRRGIAE